MYKNRIRLAVVGAVMAGLAMTASQAEATPADASANACQDFPRMIGIDNVRAYEGTGATNTTFTFTVSTWGCAHAATVSWDPLATADAFTPGGQLSWADGDLTSRTINVTVGADSIDEANETFSVFLEPGTGWTDIGGPATGTILDDDGPVKWNVDDVSCGEGDPAGGATKQCAFTVSRSVPAPVGGATVKFSTANGTAIAGTHYVTKTNVPVVVQAGKQTTSGTVALKTNDLCSVDRYLKLTLSSPSDGVLADPDGIMTIVEDDFWCDTL